MALGSDLWATEARGIVSSSQGWIAAAVSPDARDGSKGERFRESRSADQAELSEDVAGRVAGGERKELHAGEILEAVVGADVNRGPGASHRMRERGESPGCAGDGAAERDRSAIGPRC